MPRKIRKRPHGEGTLHKRTVPRKDGTTYTRWEAKAHAGYDANGKPKRITRYGRTQAEALAKLEKARRDVASGLVADEKQTVRTYLAKWVKHMEPHVKPRTLEDYRRALEKHVIPVLGGVKLTQLKPMDIQTLVNTLASTSGRRTANLCRTRLYSAMKQAVEWELIARNPVEAVKTVKETRREQIIWNPEEAVRFLAAARSHRLYALFYVAMATGLRHGELINLRWDDIEGATLHVRDSKTEAGVRRVAISPDIQEALQAHRLRQEAERVEAAELWADAGIVFASEVGTPLDRRNVTRTRHILIDRARTAWRKEAEESGDHKTVELLDAGKLMRPATTHDLRHLNVSIRRKLGQDAKLIADQIGHTDPAFTTRLYTHLFEEDREASAVDLSVAFGSATPTGEQN